MIGNTRKRLFLATIERADDSNAASLTITARDFDGAIGVLTKKELLPKVEAHKALRIEDQGFVVRDADHDADDAEPTHPATPALQPATSHQEGPMTHPFEWKEDWDNPGDWLLEPAYAGFAAAVHQEAHGYLWIVRKPEPEAMAVVATLVDARKAAGKHLLHELRDATATVPGTSAEWMPMSSVANHIFHRIDTYIAARGVRAEVEFHSATCDGDPIPNSVVVIRSVSRFGTRHVNELSEVPLQQLRARALELANEELARLQGLVARMEATIGHESGNVA